MTLVRNRPLPLALVLAAAMLFAACKKSGEPSAPAKAPEKQTLVVYSGRAEALVAPLLKRFEEESGIELRLRYADSAQLAATILEEGKNSPADVFFAQDVSTLGILEDRGYLVELPSAILSRVGSASKSASGRWVGISGRARVLTYNTDRVQTDAIPSLEELTTAPWKGRVAWSPENASFQSFVVAMIELEGVEKTRAWLEAMKANQPRAFPSNTPLVAAVAKGDVDVGLSNHYYLYRLRAELGADAVHAENHYYRNGRAESFVSLSAAGILDTSQKREAAAKLIAFLLSEEAQNHLARTNYEFPTVDGIETPAALPDIDSLDPPRIDPAKLGNLERAVALLRETGILL